MKSRQLAHFFENGYNTFSIIKACEEKDEENLYQLQQQR